MNEESEKAIPTSITLFPSQRQIVSDFATADRRSFSSAMQIIIEDWARMKRQTISHTITEKYVATHPEAELR